MRRLARRARPLQAQRRAGQSALPAFNGFKRPEVDHSKTDIFRQDIAYSQEFKTKLRGARAKGRGDDIAALDAVRAELTTSAQSKQASPSISFCLIAARKPGKR